MNALNERAYLSIGEVLSLLQDEFPDVTISKIRFLESQGLIDPERTPSGYRKFYDADIDRLRFILREQKEHFLPLRVIKDRLENGEPADGTAPAFTADHPSAWGSPSRESAPLAPAETEPMPTGGRLTADEVCAASGLGRRELAEVQRYGLVSGKVVGGVTYYDENALGCARMAANFLRYGVEPRHLRMYRNAVDREAALFEQVVLPMMKQRNPQAKLQAAQVLLELTRQGGAIREALLREALAPYLEGA